MAAFSFIFNEVGAVPELPLGAYGSLGHWGTTEPYWPWPASPLSLGEQFQCRAWHPVMTWTVLWACLSLTLPSGWSPVLSPVLPLALVCWKCLESAWLLWSEAAGEIHCFDLWALSHPQPPQGLPLCQWGHGLCWVTCAPCFDPLIA